MTTSLPDFDISSYIKSLDDRIDQNTALQIKKKLSNNLLGDGEIIVYDEDDYLPIELKHSQISIVENWLNTKQEIKSLEQFEACLKSSILSWSDDGNCELMTGGKPILRLSRINRIGAIDYKALCMAKGISEKEIEEYRKEQIGYWKLEKCE